MKKIIALVISVIMVFGCSLSAYADEYDTPIDETVVEEYQYTEGIDSNLTITNSKATCDSYVEGKLGITTRIVIVHTLQKWNGSSWNDCATWYNVYDTWVASLVTTKSSLSSGTYRLKTDVTTYSGSNYEYNTAYSAEISC